MPEDAIWVIDPTTGQEVRLPLSELEADQRRDIIKPIGGFCWKGTEFTHVPLVTAPYYLKDIIPQQGKAVIFAPPKSGKSYLCLNLARCIGAGEPFLDIPTQQGRVLYIQFELAPEVLQSRMLSTEQYYEEVYVGTTFGMKLDSEGGRKQLDIALNAIQPNLLILDPLYKLMQGDENDAKAMREITDALDAIIEGWNCSILLIHHPGKDISKGGRGSSVIEDWVDSYVRMQKIASQNGESLRIKLTPLLLRHAELPPEPIEAEMADYEFVRADLKPKVRELVEDFIFHSKEPVTPKDMFNAELGSNKAVFDAINALLKEDKIERVSRGVYAMKK